ncbi:MAG: efflux RND transporter periplasmic adaptor subunit [Burkholderiales bacterium]|nr:efflux RND transporter periplasmic adaptor subunit [Burkholderiales bacterium]
MNAPALLCLTALASVCAAHAAPNAVVQLDDKQVRLGRIATDAARQLGGQRGTEVLTLQGQAVLPPQATQVISAPLAGFVQNVRVAPGQTLSAGQPVAMLFSSALMEMQREWVQASVGLKQANERLAREEQMAADGIVAEARVREARHAQVQAQVGLDERQAALRMAGYGTAQLAQLGAQPQVQPTLDVRASLAGTVIEVTAVAGQRVEAGAPLVRIARPGPMTLELQATVAQSVRVKPGAAVGVAGCRSVGRVQAIAPVIRESNQTTTILVNVPDAAACLRPNQAVSAQVALGDLPGNAVSVPASAVFKHAGKDYVFVREKAGFRAASVVVAGRADGGVMLSQGVAAATPVVVSGVTTLKGAWLGLGETAEGGVR